MEDNKNVNTKKPSTNQSDTNAETALSKKERAKARRIETIRSNNILLTLNLIGRGLGL